jgi:hypothetical protein
LKGRNLPHEAPTMSKINCDEDYHIRLGFLLLFFLFILFYFILFLKIDVSDYCEDYFTSNSVKENRIIYSRFCYDDEDVYLFCA